MPFPKKTVIFTVFTLCVCVPTGYLPQYIYRRNPDFFFVNLYLNTKIRNNKNYRVGTYTFKRHFICHFIQNHGSWARISSKLFSKRCTYGSKSGTKSLVRRYQAKFAKTVPEHWRSVIFGLSFFLNKLCFVIFFIHIIQLSLFSSEYLPFYLLLVNIHYWKKTTELWKIKI